MARASLRGRLFAYMMKWRNTKGMFADPAATAQIIEQCRQTNAATYVMPPVRLKSRIERTTVGGMDAVILTAENPGPQVVLYFHGGAYMFQASEFHWYFLDRLVQTTHATVVAVMYPLTPVHQVSSVMPAVHAMYQALVAQTLPANVYVAGDSAGGGLALALAQELRAQGVPQPAQLWLLSPWLDVGMHNRDAEELESVDVLLSIPGLVLAGQHWAGELSTEHPWVSPLYGDVRGLAPMAIWVGTHELFLPDVRRLREMLQGDGAVVHYTEAPGMFHAYQIFPVPEANQVLQQMRELLTRGA